MLSLSEGFRLVSRMAGMPGYPFREEAEMALVAEFRRLAPDVEIAEKLIDELLGLAACPTVADLRNLRQSEPEEWKPTKPGKCPLGRCNGDGWRPVYALHSHERTAAGGGYVHKERLTAQQYQALAGKIDWQRQFLYEGVEKCECRMSGETQDSRS